METKLEMIKKDKNLMENNFVEYLLLCGDRGGAVG